MNIILISSITQGEKFFFIIEGYKQNKIKAQNQHLKSIISYDNPIAEDERYLQN